MRYSDHWTKPRKWTRFYSREIKPFSNNAWQLGHKYTKLSNEFKIISIEEKEKNKAEREKKNTPQYKLGKKVVNKTTDKILNRILNKLIGKLFK